MTPIIRVENLSKQYTLGAKAEPYTTLRESLVRAARKPIEMVRGNGRAEQSRFWALKDVSFDVMPGEVVGIIGRNGAGKSTLLKILSRITEPTSGRVELYGRVGSLLEVGTGFHPELTGRENIYLNGAILGMRREEIAKKFDEIVDFAEIEEFLDTPVKRYSSGMYVRLAFAVAAHLEPEILIVDEVLAVGDAEFQKKCLNKMKDVGEHGRTVLFVSHNMQAVLRLCQRAILVGAGEIQVDGPASNVTAAYLRSETGSLSSRKWDDPGSAPGNEVARLRSVSIKSDGELIDMVDIHRPFELEIEYIDLVGEGRPTLSVHFTNDHGITLFCTNDFNDKIWWNRTPKKGLVRAVCSIPGNLLAEGRIFVSVYLCNYNPNIVYFDVADAVSVEVVDRTTGEGVRGVYTGEFPGVVRPYLDWNVGYSMNAE
ncbi:MAG: ABC transporter ATP-binding protein [Pyrinomonadaceae bacterium]